MKKTLYLLFGHLFLIIGIIGVFLPVLPTTPFLLLSAFLYSKSSPKIHNWIINHKVLGPPLKDWQDNGVIGLKAKIFASVMILFVVIFRIPKLNIHLAIKTIAISVLLAVLMFVVSRPSVRKKTELPH